MKVFANRSSQVIKSFLKNESGATLIEYSVLVGLLLAISIGLFVAIGQDIGQIFGNISNSLGNATGGVGS